MAKGPQPHFKSDRSSSTTGEPSPKVAPKFCPNIFFAAFLLSPSLSISTFLLQIPNWGRYIPPLLIHFSPKSPKSFWTEYPSVYFVPIKGVSYSTTLQMSQRFVGILMFWCLDSLQLNIIILLQTLDLGNWLTLKELFQVQGRFCGRSFPGPAPVAVLQIRTRFLHVPQESGEVQRVLITPWVKLQRSQRSLSSLEWHW